MNWLDHALLHLASLLVREPDRSDWLAEWKSELWYVWRDCGHQHGRALRFCLGAFRDALWLRRNGSAPRRLPFLQSPFRCLAYLTVIAAVVIFVFFRSSGLIDPVLQTQQNRQGLIWFQFLLMAIALLVLPTTTSLALGEYPSRGLRRWIFLLAKFALIMPAVCFGILDLSTIMIGVPLLADGWLLGYVLAFRWAFIDQRRRCPVCLRLLAGPSRFGEASHTLLDWHGTEFFCARGHGLLQVPENRTSYNTQRWLDLDSSWASLFS